MRFSISNVNASFFFEQVGRGRDGKSFAQAATIAASLMPRAEFKARKAICASALRLRDFVLEVGIGAD